MSLCSMRCSPPSSSRRARLRYSQTAKTMVPIPAMRKYHHFHLSSSGYAMCAVSGDEDGGGDVGASHGAVGVGAAADVAGVGVVAEVPVFGVVFGDLFELGAGEVGLVGGVGGFLDLVFVEEGAGDAGEGGVHQEPFAGELVDGHVVGGGEGADQLELFEAVDFPGLVAEFAVVVL